MLLDENNNVVGDFSYMPYGGLVDNLVSGNTSYRFTGQEYDTETLLHNFRARLYDSEAAIFYGSDPAGQGYAPFAYAGNNPVIFTDPNGQIFGVDDFLIGGILLGSYIGGASANDWEFNPGDWDNNLNTYLGVIGGALSFYSPYTGALGSAGMTAGWESFAYAAGEMTATYASNAIMDGVSDNPLIQFFGSALLKGSFSDINAQIHSPKYTIDKKDFSNMRIKEKDKWLTSNGLQYKDQSTKSILSSLYNENGVNTLKDKSGKIIGVVAEEGMTLGGIPVNHTTAASVFNMDNLDLFPGDGWNAISNGYLLDGVCHQEMGRLLGIMSPVQVLRNHSFIENMSRFVTTSAYGAVGGNYSLIGQLIRLSNR